MDSTRQETGSTLMVIGWLMLFALMVAFFHPAAGGIGRTVIDAAVIALVAGGIGCNAVGFRIRGKAH